MTEDQVKGYAKKLQELDRRLEAHFAKGADREGRLKEAEKAKQKETRMQWEELATRMEKWCTDCNAYADKAYFSFQRKPGDNKFIVGLKMAGAGPIDLDVSLEKGSCSINYTGSLMMPGGVPGFQESGQFGSVLDGNGFSFTHAQRVSVEEMVTTLFEFLTTMWSSPLRAPSAESATTGD
jgi:hypothetical protein